MFASETELEDRAVELPEGRDREGDAFRRELIAKLARSNPLLGSGLSASQAWSLDEQRLLITFRNAMEEGLVRSEIGTLAQAASVLAGRTLKVELRIEGGPASRPAGTVPAGTDGHPDPVAIVERMFRGQRVERR
jgi:hypothetical protein